MYDDDLPEFADRPMYQVMPYARGIFGSSLVKLESFDDGHFRAVFKPDYFTLQDDQTEPSKSQWSTLKKKMKRHHKGVFVFREYGTVDCGKEAKAAEEKQTCFYLDFGFFAH